MHPLMAEPTPEQRCMLELIYEGRRLANSATQRRWPICQYVEHELQVRYELDLMRTLETCPAIGGQAERRELRMGLEQHKAAGR